MRHACFIALVLYAGATSADAQPVATPGPLPSAVASPGPVPSESATPPSTVPPSASPTAPASPTPPASPAPSPVPIQLDRVRVGVVPGTTVTVGVTGGSGTIVATPSSANVDVRYDPVAHRLSLTGRAPGTATVTLADDAGDSVTLAVLVAPPAGVVPSDVTVELGGIVSPQFAATKIREAIASAAQLRPGTTIDVHDARPGDDLRPGDVLEASAHVRLDGGDTYVGVDGITNVHLRVESLAQIDPQVLYYSDDPERLESGDDGVLYRNTIEASKPVRVYAYHVASKSTHDLALVLRTSSGDARVEILGYAAGPSNAFSYVGHVSTLQYLLARGSQQSSIVTVSADAPYVQMLGTRELRPGELVAAIFDVGVLDGGPVEVAVVSTSGLTDPASLADGPELPGDGHGRRGDFDLQTVPPLALTYVAGAADPPPFSIGTPTIANLRTGGRALGGDYGALRELSLDISNPGTAPADVYFYEMPAGGTATTTLWFAGDPKPTEIPCVVRPNRYTIRAFTLQPGESDDVKGEYMTDGTSSFPLLFGLTSTPPSPPPGPYSPDACNPRTPPTATPSPVPSASAIPSPASPSPVVSVGPVAPAQSMP